MGTAVTAESSGRRGQRDRRLCTVVARSGNKSIRARFEFLFRHEKYGKYLKRSTVLHAHDEGNEAAVGDVVEVVACRRYSKLKSWRLLRVVRRENPSGA